MPALWRGHDTGGVKPAPRNLANGAGANADVPVRAADSTGCKQDFAHAWSSRMATACSHSLVNTTA